MPALLSRLLYGHVFLAVCLAFNISNCIPAAGQPGATQRGASPLPAKNPALNEAIQTLFATKTFSQTAISPDGKSVAWVENVGPGKSAIYVSEVSGGKPHRITAGKTTGFHAEDSIAWSPDSKRLAFLSDAIKAGQPQVYEIGVAGGTARKLTSVKGFLASPGWSPDGKSLAVLFTENAERVAGPLAAEVQQTGVIKDAVAEQRLAIIHPGSGKLEQISPADMYVYEYDWSP